MWHLMVHRWILMTEFAGVSLKKRMKTFEMRPVIKDANWWLKRWLISEDFWLKDDKRWLQYKNQLPKDEDRWKGARPGMLCPRRHTESSEVPEIPVYPDLKGLGSPYLLPRTLTEPPHPHELTSTHPPLSIFCCLLKLNWYISPLCTNSIMHQHIQPPTNYSLSQLHLVSSSFFCSSPAQKHIHKFLFHYYH